MTSADDFIEHSLIGDHSVDHAAHATLDIAEHAHLGLDGIELAEAVEGGVVSAAGAGLVVGVAGLAFGLYIHHLGEEQQAEHIAAACELGL